MQIALNRDDYQPPMRPALRELTDTLAPRFQTAPVRLDICRLLAATLGLALYIGVPTVALGYLGTQLFG